MDELPPKAAELLAAARRDHDPSRADSERVRTLLSATIFVPGKSTPAGLVDGSALGAGQSASGFLSSVIGKAVVVLSLVGGAALGIHAVREDAAPDVRSSQRPARVESARTPVPVPTTAAASTSSLTVAPPSMREVAAHDSARAEQGVTASPVEVREPEPMPNAEPRLRSRASKPSAAKIKTAEAAAASASDQAEVQAETGELALIRGALAHLKAATAQEALALLGAHAARYPNGVMSEERDGLRAIALCRTGDLTQGVAAQQSFLRTYPNSTMAARVRRACAEAPR